eukprot:CAMPEP_0202919762 /NCGR_PEP_ID=MMETSP1392-20130828/76503_1 /ASSEMBLY_ACC=CAM_ASM_000868 /TAXON_ID=225041 /ORGANISM="Chlamydomonas chlamydogama, Strain SAG 11-48b" /LENGTH=321 /DNA_ID=CAMNT_0049613221 /DNA_START=113 /DNA_END=1078 /DNA_ORIENTATION=+
MKGDVAARLEEVMKEIAELHVQLSNAPTEKQQQHVCAQLVPLYQEQTLLLRQQVTGATGLDDFQQGFQQLTSLTRFAGVMLSMYEYTEGHISTSTVPEFKAKLKTAYSKERSTASSTGTINLIYCMISHQYLPSSGVIASHLFKRLWWANDNFLELEDIHDWRNGLLLAKPLEWAFDTSRLSIIPFSYTPRSYEVYVMDPSIKDTPLLDKLKELQVLSAEELQIFERAWKKGGKQLTFGDMHGRKLESKGEEVPQPYRRVLCLQYRCAQREARKQGWLAPGVSLPKMDDYGGSEGSGWRSQMDLFFLCKDRAGGAAHAVVR